MQFLDKYGWPVERVKGRWFLNLLRLLVHTRKIKGGKFSWLGYGDAEAKTPATEGGGND